MPLISFRIKKSACSKSFICTIKYIHTDHDISLSSDIMKLRWPHKGHKRTTYMKKNWTSCQSIQPFIKSDLSWVIESSASQAVQTSVYLLIHLFICVYCSRADLVLGDICIIVFDSFSDTALEITLCRVISMWRKNKTCLGVGIRSLTSQFQKVLQEHAKACHLVVCCGKWALLDGAVTLTGGPSLGLSSSPMGSTGQKARKSISIPLVEAE